MKITRIVFNITIIAVLIISFTNCKKKEVQTEVTRKVAYLNGGYLQTCSYNFDISSFSYTLTHIDSAINGTDTIVKTLTLVYNNFDYIYINDTTNFYKKISITDTTGSDIYIKHLDAESDIIIRPFNVLQVTLVCNLENTAFADNETLISDSMPVFTYKPFNNATEGTGNIDESENVSFAGPFYGGADMTYTGTYSFDTQIIEGTFKGQIQVNFEFYFNGELVKSNSIYSKEINNGTFKFTKLY